MTWLRETWARIRPWLALAAVVSALVVGILLGRRGRTALLERARRAQSEAAAAWAEVAAERARRRRQAALERERLDARDDHAAELAVARDDADAARAEIHDAAARPGGLADRVNKAFGLEE